VGWLLSEGHSRVFGLAVFATPVTFKVAPNRINGTKFSLERLPSREELAAGQEIGLAQPYVNEIPPSGNLDSCITGTHETGTIDPSAC
jgi:hypothetical protein